MTQLKILYGVQGTGNGHISRARMMAKHFAERDADVTFLFSGRDKNRFFAMHEFGEYLHRRGLTFSTEDGKVKYARTIFDNNIFQFFKDVRELDIHQYDVVISDFEPVTAWAAKLAGKTSIGIGHQYAFDHAVPMRGQNLATRFVMRYFAPTQRRIGLHWHHFGHPILPPMVDTQLAPISSDQSYHLVYLPLENQVEVTALLNQLPDHRFILYAPSLEDHEHGNTLLRKNCLEGFKRDLAGASGVICNTGFALISECLHMGLPVLTKPLAGQMEQQSNAAALEQLGLAVIMETLSKATIANWLLTSQKQPSTHYPDVAKTLVDWLLAGNWDKASLEALKTQLWR